MSYTPPSGSAVNGSWSGAPAYTAPAGGAVDVTWLAAVLGSGSGVIPITGSGVGTFGAVVTGVGSGVIAIAGAGTGRHGVRGTGVGGIWLLAGAGAGVHTRYELRGEVRLGGVLVNRRVRAYLRSSGELLGQADTVAGRFRVHAGFVEAECYVTPIDLDSGAVDWLPPTANRLLPVLADDAAP